MIFIGVSLVLEEQIPFWEDNLRQDTRKFQQVCFFKFLNLWPEYSKDSGQRFKNFNFYIQILNHKFAYFFDFLSHVIVYFFKL